LHLCGLGADVVKDWYSEISRVDFKNIETGQKNKLYETHNTEVTASFFQGSCPFVKIKFKDFSRTFKDHTKDI